MMERKGRREKGREDDRKRKKMNIEILRILEDREKNKG